VATGPMVVGQAARRRASGLASGPAGGRAGRASSGGRGGAGCRRARGDGGARPASESPRTLGMMKHTLAGIPPSPYAPAGMAPERVAFASQLARPRSRIPYVVVSLVALAGLGAIGYRIFTRPGKLQIVVKPIDARIAIDGVAVTGTPPIILERPPGPYHLAVEADGYVRRDQNVDVQARQFLPVEIELEPSADTGFELTSEPPGGLVWLDGQPFTSGEENAQQARTNFKAYRVAPGQHRIEIKGDARYDDWTLEFFQEPGKTQKLHADLKPRGAAPVAAKAVPAVAPAPEATPPPAVAPQGSDRRPVVPSRGSRPGSRPGPRSAPERSGVAAVDPPPRARPPRSNDDPFEKEPPSGRGGGTTEECVVSLNAKPYAEVYIDGKKIGMTPIVNHKLPCGRHKVRLWNPDLKVDRNETISAQPGEKFVKKFELVDGEE